MAFARPSAENTKRPVRRRRRDTKAPAIDSATSSSLPQIQEKEGLVDLRNLRTVLTWLVRSCLSSATVGALTPAERQRRKKTVTPPCLRARRFTISSIAIILAAN